MTALEAGEEKMAVSASEMAICLCMATCSREGGSFKQPMPGASLRGIETPRAVVAKTLETRVLRSIV